MGSYQDEEGQLECKLCPTGTHTEYLHSRSISECKGKGFVDILGRSSLNFVSSCKGRKISFLHPSFGLWFCSFIIKDRMAKEEHINLFNVSFV
jgi:CUB/sushi domain-containing protein